MVKRQLASVFIVAVVMVNFLAAAELCTKTTKAVLNGLEITFDARSGSILGLHYAGPGEMLRAEPQEATIIDLAYPIEGFEPLRLASRFSSGAKITVTDKKVTVQWDKLGASRSSLEQPGKVSAVVTLEALADGRSIAMSCEVENKSELVVRQVVFPDFSGLLPFAGEETTLFRTGGFCRKPFPELRMNERKLSNFYATDEGYGAEEFAPGRLIYDTSSMWGRWMDFGGLCGGLSIFTKQWGWDTFIPIRLHHFEDQEKLRMLYVNDVTIEPGGVWKSVEFVLTPHKSGWAKGIEPYGEWVKQKLKRKYATPKHVREGLGFRTIFMSRGFPQDPCDAIWKFSDLPKVAQESKEHGLDELCLWSWVKGFTLPLPKPQSNIGTEEEFVQAVRDCKQIGVNVTPFISVLQAGEDTAAKYGLTIAQTGGWAQHTETVPRFRPKYSTLYRCAQVDTGNQLWQKEAFESAKHLVDIGITSLAWDQFWETPAGQIYKVASRIREYAKKADPESVFAGEAVFNNVELNSEYLDYKWEWLDYTNYQESKRVLPAGLVYPYFATSDCQAYTSVFPAPRVNCIVSDSAAMAKLGFMDNRYLTVMPRKVGGINGSDWIVNHPSLSQALKVCAKLRKQFLSYFTEGRFIGNGILDKECANDAHVSSYVLPGRVLMMVINRAAADRKIEIQCDVKPWVESATGKYTVKSYDMGGELVGTNEISGPVWTSATGKLKNLEIAVYEITAE